jgi:hypothetical protein
MNCKNCQHILEENAKFCFNCGAKVITDKTTFKQLISEVIINVFGFDSKFFNTLKEMITQPQVVISDYLNGVRKRYMNPFAFLAVGAALSLLIFNYFADDFIKINGSMNSEQMAETREKANMEIPEGLSEKETKKLKVEKKAAEFTLKFTNGMMQFMLHYYNLLTFVFLFIYAILSKWTFWKPHNFGEHIVINAYIYGLTTYLSIILFLIAIIVHPSVYFFSMIGYVIFYMYSFGRFYQLSFGKNILKLFRFLLGLCIFVFTIAVIFALIGMVIGFLGLLNLE